MSVVECLMTRELLRHLGSPKHSLRLHEGNICENCPSGNLVDAWILSMVDEKESNQPQQWTGTEGLV